MIKITINRPPDRRNDVIEGVKSGIDSATSYAVEFEQRTEPVRTGTLRRSTYGDFTSLNNFKSKVVQDANVAPYGKIVNDGYDGIITPKNSKVFKLHTRDGIIYRPSVHGQRGKHFWEKIKEQESHIAGIIEQAISRRLGK